MDKWLCCSHKLENEIIDQLNGYPFISDLTSISLHHLSSDLEADRSVNAVFEFKAQAKFISESLQLELKADIFKSDESMKKQPIKAAFFDMDSTLINMEVIVALADYAGKADEVSRITEAAMRGEIDFTQSLKQRVLTLKGLSAHIIQEVKDHLPLNPGILILADYFKVCGLKAFILSGGFTPFSEHLKQILGFSETIANTLEMNVDGSLTGQVSGPVVDANFKKQYVLKKRRELEQSYHLPFQHLVVGDGANDLPMMETTNLCVGYRAKEKVKAFATYNIEYTGHDALVYLLEWIK